MKTTMLAGRSWARLVPVVLLLLLATIPLQSAAAPWREAELPAPRAESTTPLPHLAPDSASANAVSAPTAVQLMPGTRVAFQSYRDENWEIYVGQDDGTGQTRLTHHPSADIHPRLNRGATRLVFASNRTGNYEIYVMNVDGSGLAQLTFNTSDDVEPNWSPDGSLIAFQAHRDGQPEIYVMHADGSNSVRLSFNSDLTDGNAYDAQPVWSPDGTRLAFVSKRTGGYRIWAMNADGANLIQLSDQAYSFDPAWSPDGTRIAFDAAGSDGWQNLWVMNADGSGEHLLFDQYGQGMDTWVRSWSPDSRYLAYTRVQFVNVSGTWYWQSAVLEAYELATQAHSALSGVALDWHPDWQSADLHAPHSRVIALSPFSRAGSTLIEWYGSDVGGAGVAKYDVQYRTSESGAWVNWQVGTTSTSAPFDGAAGLTVDFRSRAYDHAGNAEAWPAVTDAQTSFYARSVTGRLYDGRAGPVANASLTSAPAAIAPVTSGASGQYAGYLASDGQHSLTAAHPGYGMAPPTTLTFAEDQIANFYLPPDDEVAVNGSLETGDLSGWSTTGWTQVLGSAARSGQFGVSMGQRLPQVAPALVAGSTNGSQPQAQFAPDGTLHLAWDTGSIFYTRCAPSHACDAPQSVGMGHYPRLVVEPDGAAHLLWIGPGLPGQLAIYYAARPPAGNWSTPTVLDTGDTWNYGLLDLAVGPDGTVHAMWSTVTELEYRQKPSGGAWSAIERAGPYGEPALAVAENGDLHLVWGGAAGEGVWHKVRTQAGWGQAHAIDNPYYHPRPTIALDAQGALHVLWMTLSFDDGVKYARRDANGSWTLPEMLPGSRTQWRPEIAVQHNGQLVAAWRQWPPTPGPFALAYLLSPGVWSDPLYHVGPTQVSDGDFALAAHPLSHEIAHAGPHTNEAQSGVYLSRFEFVPEQNGVSRLEQSLSVMPDLHQPTLSLAYRLHSDDVPTSDAVLISVSNGLTTTTWITSPAGSGWTYAWLDATPWQGSTITLTIELSQTANGRYTWLEVDEVSFGSWKTPRLGGITPAHIEVPSLLPESVIVSGANFIQTPHVYLGNTLLQNITWIGADQLQAEVPPTMHPGAYDLRVVNPGGQEAVLSRAVVIGWMLFLPLLWN